MRVPMYGFDTHHFQAAPHASLGAAATAGASRFLGWLRIHWHYVQLSMPHTCLGYDGFCDSNNTLRLTAQNQGLEEIFAIEMHSHR
jgi:hypothetical protein